MKVVEILKESRKKATQVKTQTIVLWILAISQFFSVFGRYIPKSEYFLMLTMLALVLITGKKISGKALSAVAAFVGLFLAGIVLSFLLGIPNNNVFLCIAFSAQAYLFISLATGGDGEFTPQQLCDFWNMILLAGIFACCYNLAANIDTIWNLTPEGYAYGVNFSAYYVGRNEFGYYLFLLTAVSAYQLLTQKKIKYAVAGGLFLLNLFLTFSRASILATAVFVMVLTLLYVCRNKRLRKILLLAMIPVLILGAWVIWNNFEFLNHYLFRISYGDSYRFEVWSTGAQYFAKSPIFGFGPGAAEFMLEGIAKNTANSLHLFGNAFMTF